MNAPVSNRFISSLCYSVTVLTICKWPNNYCYNGDHALRSVKTDNILRICVKQNTSLEQRLMRAYTK